jgi:hypothetical protein
MRAQRLLTESRRLAALVSLQRMSAHDVLVAGRVEECAVDREVSSRRNWLVRIWLSVWMLTGTMIEASAPAFSAASGGTSSSWGSTSSPEHWWRSSIVISRASVGPWCARSRRPLSARGERKHHGPPVRVARRHGVDARRLVAVRAQGERHRRRSPRPRQNAQPPRPTASRRLRSCGPTRARRRRSRLR